MSRKQLTVAWISDFPVEWLSDVPDAVRSLPKQHPGTWQMVLLEEFEKNPDLKIHVIVLRKNIPQPFAFDRNGVTFHILKTIGGSRAPSLYWTDTLLIGKTLKKIRPDLIHAWGTERGAALVASRLNYPYVYTIQGLFNWYQEQIPTGWQGRFGSFIERISLRRARVITTESTFAVKYLKERFSHLKIHQAEHASNWLFHRVERKPVVSPLRLVSIGTLSHRKGSDLLFTALDVLQKEISFELIVISGPNPTYLESLRSTVSSALWEKVCFENHLSPADVAAQLAKATFVILPTRADTSPNAIKESVVAGVPVVASAVGGIVDYVFPGKNGILFAPNDLEACIQAIREAAQHPLFSKGNVDSETLRKTRDYLSPPRMAENFLHAYRSVE